MFEYVFIQNAFWAMVLLAVLSGIVGTLIVVRRRVFIAGGITHASFGGIGIAYYLGLNTLFGALLFAVATALGIEALGKRGKVRPDSAVAMLWAVGMSVGLIFMFLTPGYANNLMGFMFGDMLAVTQTDILCMLIVSAVLLLLVVLFYNRLLYFAFSPSYMKVKGENVNVISTICSIGEALAIVLAIKAVGIILVLSLFTVPQAIAGLLTKRLKWQMVLAGVVALLACVGGLLLSFAFDLPVSAVVTLLLAACFGIVKICC